MVILLTLTSQIAAACAGLVHAPTDAVAESDTAEVIFEQKNDGSIAVTYAARYEGDAAEFGWVIPVPGDLDTVSDGDVDLLAAVRELSQPVVTRVEHVEAPSACGCAGSDNNKAGSLGDTGPQRDGDVTVVDEGFTGTYEYVVVQAVNADDLSAWFDEHGWAGVDASDLDHYVQLGASFVALTISPEVAVTPEGGALLPPVRLTYEGELRFPAVMARHAEVPEQRTTLYVLGGGRAEVTGWSFTPSTDLAGHIDDDPEAMWRDALAEVGAQKGYALTFADSFEGRFLTRFDTLAPTAVHDADPLLTLTSDPTPHRTEIVLTEPGAGGGGAAAVLLLPVLGAALRRRER